MISPMLLERYPEFPNKETLNLESLIQKTKTIFLQKNQFF